MLTPWARSMGANSTPALAHQRHDDVSPHLVVGRQRVAADDRQPALAERLVVLRQRLRVLVVGRADATDGRNAERHEVAVGLRAVALEVPMQPAFALGHRQRVVRQREVVHADVAVVARQESGDGVPEHGDALRGVGRSTSAMRRCGLKRSGRCA